MKKTDPGRTLARWKTSRACWRTSRLRAEFGGHPYALGQRDLVAEFLPEVGEPGAGDEDAAE